MSVIVEQRPDGSYRVRLRQKDAAGKWKVTEEAGGFTSRRDADRAAAQLRGLQRDGKLGIRTDTPTCGALLDDYLDAMEKAKKPSAKNVRASVVHLAPIADVQVGELSAVQLQAVIDAIAADVGAHPAKKAIDHLRTAVRRRGLTSAAATNARAPKAPKRRHRVLTADEARALLPFISDVFRDLYALSLHTGLRPSELASMFDIDVDEGEGALYVRRSFTRRIPKDGDERRVVLSTEALAIVKRTRAAAQRSTERPTADDAAFNAKLDPAGCVWLWPAKVRRIASDTGLVVPLHRAIRRAVDAGAIPSLSRGWALKCRRHGCGHAHQVDVRPTGDEKCPRCNFTLWPSPQVVRVRWYDLRHTSATLLVEAGVDPTIVSELLGHHSPAFTMERYVHLSTKALRRATEHITLEKDAGGGR